MSEPRRALELIEQRFDVVEIEIRIDWRIGLAAKPLRGRRTPRQTGLSFKETVNAMLHIVIQRERRAQHDAARRWFEQTLTQDE